MSSAVSDDEKGNNITATTSTAAVTQIAVLHSTICQWRREEEGFLMEWRRAKSLAGHFFFQRQSGTNRPFYGLGGQWPSCLSGPGVRQTYGPLGTRGGNGTRPPVHYQKLSRSCCSIYMALFAFLLICIVPYLVIKLIRDVISYNVHKKQRGPCQKLQVCTGEDLRWTNFLFHDQVSHRRPPGKKMKIRTLGLDPIKYIVYDEDDATAKYDM